MLIVLHDGKATVCGPVGDDPPALSDVDIGQAERICREALEQPDRHAALRCLRDALPSVESHFPGIRNEGFLATHELTRGIRAEMERPLGQRRSQGPAAARTSRRRAAPYARLSD